MIAATIIAASIWGLADPTGNTAADHIWRGLAAAVMFVAAGTRDRVRIGLAVVGVGALSLIEGLAAAPLWLALLVVVIWVRRPPLWSIALVVVAVGVVGGLGAYAGYQASTDLRSARTELADLRVADIEAVDELDGSIAVIEARLDDARHWIDAPWAVPARYLPLVGAHLGAADDVIDATDLVFDAVSPLRTLDVSDFAVAGGVDLASITRTSTDVAALSTAAAEAGQIVADIDRSWLLPTLDDDLDDATTTLSDGADDAQRLARLLDGVWRQAGGQRPQRWFVLLCSPVESRASCGFPGNYVVLDISDGHFSVAESGRVSDIERRAIAADLQLTIGGDYQARYEARGVAQTWRSITVSPNWPDVADAIRQLYGDLTGTTIDVVAGVNTEGMAAVMQLTGPVEVADFGLISSDNVRRIVEKEQYALYPDSPDRLDALAELTDAVVAALLQVNDIDAAQLRAMADSVGNGAIVAHAADDPENLFADAGIDGAVPRPTIAVTWQNAAANKLDAYMETTFGYRNPGAEPGCVVFTIHNIAPENLPGYVAGTGAVVAPRTNRSWLSVYSPTGIEGITVDGTAVAFTSEFENGSFVAALFVDIAPGQTTTIETQLAAGASEPAEPRIQPASIPTELVDLAPDACQI